jgi:hypothetical protein
MLVKPGLRWAANLFQQVFIPGARLVGRLNLFTLVLAAAGEGGRAAAGGRAA